MSSSTARAYSPASLIVDYEISDIIKTDKVFNAKVDLNINILGETNNDEELFELELTMRGYFEGDCEKVSENKFEDIKSVKVENYKTMNGNEKECDVDQSAPHHKRLPRALSCHCGHHCAGLCHVCGSEDHKNRYGGHGASLYGQAEYV